MQVVESFANPQILSIGQVHDRKTFKITLIVAVILILIVWVCFVINTEQQKQEKAKKP
jgi:preprotein translocase subunit YajC